MPRLSNYLVVYVHQVQTYKEDLMSDKYKDISFEQAIIEDGVSVEIMDRVVKYFNNQNKKVYIMTHSFGSFMIPQYIATKESSKLVKNML